MAFFVVSQTFENPVIQMAGMVVGAIAMGYATSGLYAGLGEVAQAAASGATASFSTTYITTGNFGDSVQAGVIGGLSAGITNGLAHGEGSPFNAQTGSLRAALPLAHGVVQGGFHELQGGSFKQGFISGVIGKLGGGIVHANVQTQTLQAGGMIIVSGIAAAASGSNSRDAVMRSAVSVIAIYLYNDSMSFKDKMTKGWSIFKKVEFQSGLTNHMQDHAIGAVAGASLQPATSGFLGIFGASHAEGLAGDASLGKCHVSTTCVQFGLGAHASAGMSGSLTLAEKLAEGHSETWGVFLNSPLQSYSFDASQSGSSVGRGLWGPGAGLAAGVQFCQVEVKECL